MLNSFFTLTFLLFVCGSCAQKPEEKVREAIDVAQTLLSENKCTEAIDLLEDLGRQTDNAVYLQVLASGYACRAGFRMIPFIENDLEDIDSSDFMASLARMSLSAETTVDSAAYRDLKESLLILTSTDKQLARNDKFGVRKAGDMGVQLLVLSLVYYGKYLRFFGNTDSNGDKGAGTNTNSCFLNYTYPPAMAVVGGGMTGACTTTNDGHPDLSGSELRRRLCEGSVTIANVIDAIKNIDLSASASLSSLEDLTATVDDYRADANAAGVGHLIDLTSYSACEALLQNAAEMNNMQLYFASGFEIGLQ